MWSCFSADASVNDYQTPTDATVYPPTPELTPAPPRPKLALPLVTEQPMQVAAAEGVEATSDSGVSSEGNGATAVPQAAPVQGEFASFAECRATYTSSLCSCCHSVCLNKVYTVFKQHLKLAVPEILPFYM